MSLGLPQGHNYLVPHDPEWPKLFEGERMRLRSVLPAEAVDIQHIGSTAVPGLLAKPIIDIAIGARSYSMAEQWQEAMASLGYDYPGDIGIPDHRIYGRDPGTRRFLGHVVDFGGTRWNQFIRFRDLLIAEPRLAAEYEVVKQQAARKHPTGVRSRYTEAKAGYIDGVLAHEFGNAGHKHSNGRQANPPAASNRGVNHARPALPSSDLLPRLRPRRATSSRAAVRPPGGSIQCRQHRRAADPKGSTRQHPGLSTSPVCTSPLGSGEVE
jgi:GrpB-like predicted nucleotidyltransferase (UPF0157 family)